MRSGSSGWGPPANTASESTCEPSLGRFRWPIGDPYPGPVLATSYLALRSDLQDVERYQLFEEAAELGDELVLLELDVTQVGEVGREGDALLLEDHDPVLVKDGRRAKLVNNVLARSPYLFCRSFPALAEE